LVTDFCKNRENPAALEARGIRSQAAEFHDKSFMFALKKMSGFTQNLWE
jgi:hypothetical protein